MDNNIDAIIFIQGNLSAVYVLCITGGDGLLIKSYKTVRDIEKRQLA